MDIARPARIPRLPARNGSFSRKYNQAVVEQASAIPTKEESRTLPLSMLRHPTRQAIRVRSRTNSRPSKILIPKLSAQYLKSYRREEKTSE